MCVSVCVVTLSVSLSADFSDRVSRPVQSGFRAEPIDYELIAGSSREPETLLQRFHRLKQEVAELETEVQALQSSEAVESVSPVDLLQDVSGGAGGRGCTVFCRRFSSSRRSSTACNWSECWVGGAWPTRSTPRARCC